MGIAVAAAGSLAGSMAAGKIMGEPTAPGPDTSAAGVGSATIKPAKKGDPGVKVAQVDPTAAINYYKQAAQQQTSSLQTGLQFYQGAMETASKLITEGFDKSNITLTPAANASTQAMNEQLRMLGITPIAPTKDLISQLGVAGPQYSDLQKAIQDANSITDPTQRAQVKQQIIGQFNSAKGTVDYAGQIKALGPTPTLQGSPFDANTVNLELNPNIPMDAQLLMKQYGYPIDAENYNKFLKDQPQVAAYNAKVQALQKQQADQEAANSQIQKYADQFGNLYDTANPSGYNAQQVTEKITATPGYQFTVDQGNQAIARKAAATNNLASGNTLVALQNYGQNTALGYYNQYMSNLANIANQGSGALSQIANNQAQMGTLLGNVAAQVGQTGYNTYVQIGNAQAAAANNAGNAMMDAGKFNAAAQNAGLDRIANKETALQQQGIASGAGYLAQGLQQQQFNYSVFQNQQAGRQYYNV